MLSDVAVEVCPDLPAFFPEFSEPGSQAPIIRDVWRDAPGQRLLRWEWAGGGPPVAFLWRYVIRPRVMS